MKKSIAALRQQYTDLRDQMLAMEWLNDIGIGFEEKPSKRPQQDNSDDLQFAA